MIRFIVAIALFLLPFGHVMAQGVVGIKTNLLYGGATLTPNLGVEVGLGRHTTLDIAVGYNPWKINSSDPLVKKLAHVIVQPEFRYYPCERFNGHFFGVHAIYSNYNINRHELPMLFGKGSKNYRFEGNAWGAGISYGYQFLLGLHWNLEAEIGVGYMRLDYDKYRCATCGPRVGEGRKNYFGPTKVGISLIYIIK